MSPQSCTSSTTSCTSPPDTSLIDHLSHLLWKHPCELDAMTASRGERSACLVATHKKALAVPTACGERAQAHQVPEAQIGQRQTLLRQILHSDGRRQIMAVPGMTGGTSQLTIQEIRSRLLGWMMKMQIYDFIMPKRVSSCPVF